MTRYLQLFVLVAGVSPGSCSHDASSILRQGLAAALTVMVHPKIMPHLMSHGGSDPKCNFRVVLEIEREREREKDEACTYGKEIEMLNNTAVCFTELTPPDWYSEHIAFRGASPIVVPWNAIPLKEPAKDLLRSSTRFCLH